MGTVRGARAHLAGALPGGHFGAPLRFAEALVAIGSELVAVPRERRNEALRARLADVNGAHLPSNVVYVPVAGGNARHRVYAIHADESFAFSTKDRCPFLACLEVVDYFRAAPAQPRRRWWAPALRPSRGGGEAEPLVASAREGLDGDDGDDAPSALSEALLPPGARATVQRAGPLDAVLRTLRLSIALHASRIGRGGRPRSRRFRSKKSLAAPLSRRRVS